MKYAEAIELVSTSRLPLSNRLSISIFSSGSERSGPLFAFYFFL